MGQGDNQVLITHYYPSPTISIREQHARFLRHLNIFLEQIGPPIKLEESWSSSHFFTYGKFPILSGIPLMMSLNKMSRCGRLNNGGMLNLDSVLSSISANTSSAITLSRNLFFLLYARVSQPSTYSLPDPLMVLHFYKVFQKLLWICQLQPEGRQPHKNPSAHI